MRVRKIKKKGEGERDSERRERASRQE